MITQPRVWQKFEKQLQAKKNLTYRQACKIFDTLYWEARSLGVLPSKNPLEGIEVDIRLAAALNRLATKR